MASQEIKLGRLIDCTFAEALELRNRGFEQYYSDMTTTMERLIQTFHNHSIHPGNSIVAYVDGKPVGFVFIGIKTVNGKKLAWNGGTGVFPEYRGRGIAKAMMLEAQKVIKDQEVDRAILEVVTKNSHAIAAYEKGGFRIVDQVIGMVHDEALEQPFHADSLPEGMTVTEGSTDAVRSLSFYQEMSAWNSMWHGIPGGSSYVLTDKSGKTVGYALFVRRFNEDGQITSVDLRQCVADPDQDEQMQRDILHILLQKVFGPHEQTFKRTTSNLSKAPLGIVDLLKQAGFTTKYEQYVMIMDRED